MGTSFKLAHGLQDSEEKANIQFVCAETVEITNIFLRDEENGKSGCWSLSLA
jgi:hypothetical protein